MVFQYDISYDFANVDHLIDVYIILHFIKSNKACSALMHTKKSCTYKSCIMIYYRNYHTIPLDNQYSYYHDYIQLVSICGDTSYLPYSNIVAKYYRNVCSKFGEFQYLKNIAFKCEINFNQFPPNKLIGLSASLQAG